MKGESSHHLVETAIHSLSCMTHRGGIAADGKTGDGCGLLLAMPKQFFRDEAKKLSDITLSEIFAVGTVFLNICLLYTSPSPRDLEVSRMPSSA